MEAPRIIAVTAPSRRSGKGTITDVLVSEYGYTELAFATPIKTMFIALCMHAEVPQHDYPRILDGDMKETPIERLGGLSLRTFAEGVGTTWGRKMFSESLWVDIAKGKIASLLSRGERVVISDVRFPNECDMVRNLGGEVWSVVRPEWNGGLKPTLASEGHLADYTFDRMFINDGGVRDLQTRIRTAMHRIALTPWNSDL